jgi:hypothetical protein
MGNLGSLFISFSLKFKAWRTGRREARTRTQLQTLYTIEFSRVKVAISRNTFLYYIGFSIISGLRPVLEPQT